MILIFRKITETSKSTLSHTSIPCQIFLSYEHWDSIKPTISATGKSGLNFSYFLKIMFIYVMH